MTVESDKDLAGLRNAGRVVRLAMEAMKANLQPGMTTTKLDAIGAEVFERHGARSAPQLVYDFPGVNCISINDEAVHGIPGGRIIEPGDLIKIDVSAELDGYIADAAVVGAGLAVLGLAVLGNALSPSWEPRRPPADFGYGSLPPVPEPTSSAGSASYAIEREDVRMPVRDTVHGGTVVSPAEDGRYPAVVFVNGAAWGARALLLVWGGLNVAAGALVLTGVVATPAAVDWMALR